MNVIDASSTQADTGELNEAASSALDVFKPCHGLNPLVQAAHPLLEAGTLLRHAPVQPALQLEALRAQLVGMVRDFVTACAAIDTETVAAARYCLCTFVDEAIGATEWGGQAWSTRSLLVLFHGETSGGERFFTILHKLSQNPAANIDALELLYVILALGMEGRYRLTAGGGAALGQVRDKLHALIRATRGSAHAVLSPHARGDLARRGRPWPSASTAWLLFGVACLCATLYTVLDARLHRQAQPVAAARASVHVARPVSIVPAQAPVPASAEPAHVPPARSAPAPAPFAPQLLDLLAPDIAAHRLSVELSADRATLTLHTDGVFASGSAWVKPAHVALIRRIGTALRDVPGQVVVVGHTDDQPPAPGAPSNWALSLARATHVVDLLREETAQPQRFLAQGRGDADPVAPNDTPTNRARNRRVVITVLAPGAAL
jgi:type VI secretion system protein ImpK